MAASQESITQTKLEKMRDGKLRNAAGALLNRLTDADGLVVRYRGKKMAFGFDYGGRKARGFKTVGHWDGEAASIDKARRKMHEMRALLADGVDLVAKAKVDKAAAARAGFTVADMVQDWMTGHQYKHELRAADEVQADLNRHLFGKQQKDGSIRPPTMGDFGSMSLADLEDADDGLAIVSAALAKIVDKKGRARKTTQNHMHSHLRSAANFRTKNRNHKFRFPLPPKPFPKLEGRDRALRVGELRDVLAALKEYDNEPVLPPQVREAIARRVVDGGQSMLATAREFNTSDTTVRKWVQRYRAEGVDGLRDRPSVFPQLVRVILLTGCRRDEVGGMHAREFVDGEWIIPKERYKTKRPHRLPLVPALVKLLPRKTGFIFSSIEKGEGTPFQGFENCLNILRAKIDEIRVRDGRLPATKQERWTLHDLRRTASTLINEHFSQQIVNCKDLVKAVLGHANPQIEALYNRSQLRDAKADVLTKWAAFLETLEPSPPDDRKVVPFNQPKVA